MNTYTIKRYPAFIKTKCGKPTLHILYCTALNIGGWLIWRIVHLERLAKCYAL